jgi:hypothetical protein
MNTFTAKKLGEVLAFGQVGLETINRGQSALEKVFGREGVMKLMAEIESHVQDIEKIANHSGSSDITMAKAQATGLKLLSMRDLYVGDEWDNPTELIEWHGFFEGAAIVHWELVLGAATGLDQEDLQTVAADAIIFHKGLLAQASEYLRTIGSARSNEADE